MAIITNQTNCSMNYELSHQFKTCKSGDFKHGTKLMKVISIVPTPAVKVICYLRDYWIWL